MILLKLLMFTLAFYELALLDAKMNCPKGHRVVANSRCEICHRGTYQVTDNASTRCHGICKKCDEQSGSVNVKQCTNERNAECQCRSGFVPSDSDYSTCKCDIGFGLSIHNGIKECSKCEHGYFNARINSHCKKWKECKSVGTPGTTTSDVICDDTYATRHPTPTQTIFKSLTSRRPQEGPANQKVHSTATTTTTTTKSSTASDRNTATTNVQAFYPSSKGNYIGMALLIFGIVGLLLLTAVTCKLHITPYLEKQQAETKNESCRRPVEESGDGSLSPLKQNADEP